METQRKPGGNPAALLPILVFLVLYLGMGLIFEYGLHIYQGFSGRPHGGLLPEPGPEI